MASVGTRIRQALNLAVMVVRRPSELRYLPRWISGLRSNTVQLRLPWISYRAIDRLEEVVSRESTVFEFGGGGSTLWFAERCRSVVTVEHDPQWFPALEELVGNLENVELIHETDQDDWSGYVNAIGHFPDAHFDLVVVDGRERVRCLEQAMPKVKPGGYLVLDNSDRARYQRALTFAAAWPSETFRGLVPTLADQGCTTIWQRPVDESSPAGAFSAGSD